MSLEIEGGIGLKSLLFLLLRGIFEKKFLTRRRMDPREILNKKKGFDRGKLGRKGRAKSAECEQ